MNQCISQSPCTLHFNYYFLCSAPSPVPTPATELTFFCMLWPQFKNCSTNGKTNTRRTERGKKKRQAKFLPGNVMLLAGATLLDPCLHYKYCITIICLASCELDFMLMQSPYRPLHMSCLTWAVPPFTPPPALWFFICFPFFYFCW